MQNTQRDTQNTQEEKTIRNTNLYKISRRGRFDDVDEIIDTLYKKDIPYVNKIVENSPLPQSYDNLYDDIKRMRTRAQNGKWKYDGDIDIAFRLTGKTNPSDFLSVINS